MAEVKVVVTDLDETLIHEDPTRHIHIRRSVLDALVGLDKSNIPVLPSTGRDFFRRPWITRQLGFDRLGGFRGGTSIVDLDKEKTVWEKRLAVDIAKPLLAQILASVEPAYVNYGKGRIEARTVDVQDVTADCFGIWAEIPRSNLAIFEAIASAYPIQYYDNSGSTIGPETAALHITHKEADKGVSLLELLDRSGFQPDEAVVIGDGPNDGPMFALPGLHSRIAIQHEGTPTSLLEAADYVVGSVHQDGFAAAVKNHILG